ncbi:MAG: adenine deaminase [Gaiellales bacterium]
MLEGIGRRRLIDVARGDAEPDLVIEHAHVFSAFTKEWLELDVAIADGRVAGLGSYPGGERVDARGRYLVPGFVDAHVHIESSKLMVDEFARAVLARGTTAVVADPHEIANVLGTDGIHWLLDVCDDVPLDVWVMASSCVPASRFESPRRPLSVGDLESVLRRRHALGVAEMMNFPAVIAGDPAELRKLALRGATHADGHAPGVRGKHLDAYLAAGIRSDHESTTYAEALEKRRKGAWVLIREASNARNLHALLPLVREFGPERCAFCTDDREPDFLVREGHLDQMCREAVAEGIAPEDALLLASLHPALYHGLVDAGAIAPGYRADLVLLDDLVSFCASRVYKDGALVFDGVDVTPFPRPDVPVWVRQTVHAAPVGLSDLRVPSSGRPVRVIEIVPEQLLTHARIELPTLDGPVAVADPGRDLAKIAVVERHHATGRVGVGFVRGFGLQRGAFATTVAHDAHNIVCVGVDDHDMALAIARLGQIGGGIVVHADGDVRGELPLPVAGLLSDRPATEVVERLELLERLLVEQGVAIASPFMSLSFLALSVIPSLKITDLGLVDVDRFELVPLTVDRLSLGELNALDRATFVAFLDGVFEHSPWVVEGAFDARPFSSLRMLDDACRAVLAAASDDRRIALVRAHPDLAGRAALAGELTADSASEQTSARLDRLSAFELAEFTRLNDSYRERFGFPFVVCVREHTVPTILDAFAARLGHSPERELDSALDEIAKIAALRMGDRIEEVG